MFKVNNKDTRTTPNNEDTRTSVCVISVSIINFEHAIAGWVSFYEEHVQIKSMHAWIFLCIM